MALIRLHMALYYAHRWKPSFEYVFLNEKRSRDIAVSGQRETRGGEDLTLPASHLLIQPLDLGDYE